MLMDADVVESTLCGIKAPLGVDAAKAKIAEWSSKVFGTVLGNVSNAQGFREEVCSRLSCDGLEGVGVDAEVVRGMMCS